MERYKTNNFVAHFKLPGDLLTTDLNHSKVIKISYTLQIEIANNKMNFPITISLVPLDFSTAVLPKIVPVTTNSLRDPTTSSEASAPLEQDSRE